MHVEPRLANNSFLQPIWNSLPVRFFALDWANAWKIPSQRNEGGSRTLKFLSQKCLWISFQLVVLHRHLLGFNFWLNFGIAKLPIIPGSRARGWKFQEEKALCRAVNQCDAQNPFFCGRQPSSAVLCLVVFWLWLFGGAVMWRDVMSCGWTRGHESWVVPAGVSSAVAVLRAEILTRIDSCTVWGGGVFLLEASTVYWRV